MKLKLKQFLAILLVSISTIMYAQTPTLIASGTFKASGAGASGIPTINFNIPAGKNRVMIICLFAERVHSPYASNHLVNADGSTNDGFLIPQANGINSAYLDANIGFSNTGTPGNIYFTSRNDIDYISDAMGLPTGMSTITFPNVRLPENDGDEMMVMVSVFENAKQVPVYIDFANIANVSASANFLTVTGTAQPIPEQTKDNL